jgi:hypothetical protein
MVPRNKSSIYGIRLGGQYVEISIILSHRHRDGSLREESEVLREEKAQQSGVN